jgi:phosphohistidine phosphatase
MARQLWLLRHAEAEPHGTRADHDRRLTGRGEDQARAAGAALMRLGVEFDAVLYSPKVRAQQTAELAAESWPEEQRERLRAYPPLAGGFDAGAALAAIEEARARVQDSGASGRVLLVGHEPDLSNVIAGIAGGRADVKKGGLAILRLEGPGGELLALVRPRELALIAGVPVGRE